MNRFRISIWSTRWTLVRLPHPPPTTVNQQLHVHKRSFRSYQCLTRKEHCLTRCRSLIGAFSPSSCRRRRRWCRRRVILGPEIIDLGARLRNGGALQRLPSAASELSMANVIDNLFPRVSVLSAPTAADEFFSWQNKTLVAGGEQLFRLGP